MNQNTKPQVLNLGNRVIDGESITDNVTAIDALSAKPKWTFGKSSPIITARDIWLNDYLHDAHWYESKLKTDSDLRAQGLKPIWSLDDQLRAVEFESRKAIANLMGGDAA